MWKVKENYRVKNEVRKIEAKRRDGNLKEGKEIKGKQRKKKCLKLELKLKRRVKRTADWVRDKHRK